MLYPRDRIARFSLYNKIRKDFVKLSMSLSLYILGFVASNLKIHHPPNVSQLAHKFWNLMMVVIVQKSVVLFYFILFKFII